MPRIGKRSFKNNQWFKARKTLVYDVSENRVQRMTKSDLKRRYSDIENESVSIPIPKGAVRMDLTTDDITPREPTASERAGAPLAITSKDLSHGISNKSYFASIHIPSFVYWARVISPDSFSELTVVSPKSTPDNSPSNSANSTRNNTDDTPTWGPHLQTSI